MTTEAIDARVADLHQRMAVKPKFRGICVSFLVLSLVSVACSTVSTRHIDLSTNLETLMTVMDQTCDGRSLCRMEVHSVEVPVYFDGHAGVLEGSALVSRLNHVPPVLSIRMVFPKLYPGVGLRRGEHSIFNSYPMPVLINDFEVNGIIPGTDDNGNWSSGFLLPGTYVKARTAADMARAWEIVVEAVCVALGKQS